MHTPFYRLVFRDAWHAAWRNKRLWILGLLSAFWGIAGLRMVSGWKSVIFSKLSLGDLFAREMHIGIPLGPVGLPSIASFVTFVALLALLLWMVTAARGGIFWALSKAGAGELGDGAATKAIHVGTKRFWPVLGVHLLANLAMGGLFIAAVLTAMGVRTVGVFQGVLGWCAVVVFTVAALFVGVVSIFTTIGIVSENLTIAQAWNMAWRHLHRHWLVVLETAGLLYILSAVAAGVMLLVGVSLAFPIFMVLIATSLVASKLALWLIAVPAGIIILAALMVFGALYSTFEAAAWTHLYSRTRENSPIPTVLRLFNVFRARIHR